MLAIAIRFAAGRYHATPWGHHVNEGVPEWPPSPWRLLRALVAVWKRKCPAFRTEQLLPLLQQLAEPPEFVLPPATVAHTRHYMPWGKKGPGDRTLVLDTFVCVHRDADLILLWPRAELAGEQGCVLDTLLAHLGFLGRAESWCGARRLPAADALGLCANCSPLAGRPPRPDEEAVRVLCADPAAAFANDFTPRVQPAARGRPSAPGRPLYDPDWHLAVETLDLHQARRCGLPGARWVSYRRRADALRPGPQSWPAVSEAPRTSPRPAVARFALDGAVLPPVEQTLPLAELVRRALLELFAKQQRGGSPWSEALAGKDAAGNPLRGHRHAYYLPTDEDGDGRIDHVTVWAAMGLGAGEVAALDRLRVLRFGAAGPFRLLLVGLGQEDDFNAPPFARSAVWESASPFVVTRHPKANGVKRDPPELLLPGNGLAFALAVLREELARLCERRGWSALVEVEALSDWTYGGTRRVKGFAFRRSRGKEGDDGVRRAQGAFRIRFAEEVSGPLVVGHASHFGLGQFLPPVHASSGCDRSRSC